MAGNHSAFRYKELWGMKKLYRKSALQAENVLVFHTVIMALYGAQLLESSAYYVVYLLLIVAAFLCLYTNHHFQSADESNKSNTLETVFSILFSLMIALSNYSIWAISEIPMEYGSRFRFIHCFVLVVIFFLGGYITFRNIFHTLSLHLEKTVWNTDARQLSRPRIAFWFSFLTIIITRILVLHFGLYPGNLTPDSVNQINQILSGSYSNHHPFYHTQVIRICLNLGMALFHSMNASVATFCLIQVLFTAACFSLAVSTIAQMRVPKWIVLCSMIFFICMPYHLIYSITVWKDVPFGCFMLLLVLSLYRLLAGIGKSTVNIILFGAASLGACLFRSNGFFVMVLLLAAFVVLWKKKYPVILIVLLSTLAVSFVLKHPVLEYLNVRQPDTIESLSIPAQQIARVVAEDHPLKDWERDTLSLVVDLNEIPAAYQKIVSDPIKDLVRQKGNQCLLVENKWDYIRVYFSLGSRYPGVFARAWIDQTKGYWNAGYSFWTWNTDVSRNEFDVTRIIRSSFLYNLLNIYLYSFSQIQLLRLFVSIGLFVWFDLVMLYISLLRKDRIGIFMCLPILMTVLSLLIATPVFSEFRYIYAAFCVMPVVAVIVFRPANCRLQTTSDP